MVCSTKHNDVISRRTHPNHGTAPVSLYNQHTITFREASDHKNCGQKKDGHQVLVLRQGGACAKREGFLPKQCALGVWCLVSECLEPIPPDAPDTAAPARLGWTSHTAVGAASIASLSSPPRPPPPLPWVPADTLRMGTRPMPSVLPKVIYSAWTHAQCPQFCQK